MSFRYILLVVCFTVVSLQVSARQQRINIIVDERMELLNTIQYLAEYPVLTPAALQYKNDIDTYFRDFRDHNAVRLYRNIYRRYFAFDAPPTYIYHMSFPDFLPVTPFSRNEIEGYGFEANKDTLTMLMAEFRNFYHSSRFHDFYLAHQPFYDSLTGPVKAKLQNTDVINVLEKHYGRKMAGYNVVLSPLEHDGGYEIEVPAKDGVRLYAIIGPMYDSKSFPEFDLENLLAEYVIHEFSHAFCNPLITGNLSQLQQDSCLLTPIKTSQKEQGYGRWETCLYEHFVRANEIVINEIIFGKEKADRIYKDMVEKDKWIYLEGLVPVIHQYISDRKKYRTLHDIMPQVIAYFHLQAKNCH